MHFKKPHPRIPVFLIFYSTTFTVCALILGALLLIMLGDHLYQAIRYEQLYHVFIVAGVYFLTSAAALFIYAGRLFSTRSALAKIPRDWNLHSLTKDGRPVLGLGLGMGRTIGHLVRTKMERSALISYESTPRDIKTAPPAIILPPSGENGIPFWDSVKLAGWLCRMDSQPVNFELVLQELVHLIEAKVVSMHDDQTVVDLVVRPPGLGLVGYIRFLNSQKMLSTHSPAQDFSRRYEEARFSCRPLAEDEFHALMTSFSRFLQTLLPLRSSDSSPSSARTVHKRTLPCEPPSPPGMSDIIRPSSARSSLGSVVRYNV